MHYIRLMLTATKRMDEITQGNAMSNEILLLKMDYSAETLFKKDPIGFRLKAIRRLALEGDGAHHLTDILLNVANLMGHTREEIDGSEQLDRVFEDAAWLNRWAEEEAEHVFMRNEQVSL